MMPIRSILPALLLLWSTGVSFDLSAQQVPPPATRRPTVENVRPAYTLGVGDQITIHAADVEEISDKPYRVDPDGNVNLPVLGTMPAAGVTLEEFENSVKERLKPLVRNPQVVVAVVQYRSEPVFFEGALNSPGVYPLQGKKTLVEMLTTIGGLQPNAGRRIKVSRRLEFGPIPLPNAIVDRQAGLSTVDISLASLVENINPAEDLVLQPFDVIRVEPGDLVYVSGEVGKVGGIELGQRDSLPVTQLLSMAGGLTKEAMPEKSRILRPILNTSRRAEIPVDIKKIMEGKERDFPLMPNDVLYVPRTSGLGKAVATAALVAVPVVPTILYLILR